ncbi:c-di-GMP phosphodiesterase [Ureibacillus massiliensis 4400831 = CIP 108448 = CCUG 49529]|uniref:C-di-GMP phosphodiesterase n=1 Tax=Ureibacillus massiliensis 4400831 = CIP 108448 = CCUG 49529 TaxID=1211035 RepID=A0A0A3JWG8_9BACL|nr:GGDEF domain-containing protein [Ureibacillus massiliensis]KGR91322.1 c-di-GMP phosphodiesterase [Ureibacillus massiliensis 4400831 = CIP 108448 = CCUG 49529]
MNGNESIHRLNTILFILITVFYFVHVIINIIIEGFGSVFPPAFLFIVFDIIFLLLIYKKIEPQITMYVIVIGMYIYFYYLLSDSPFLVNYLFMWLALPLSTIYENTKLVMIAGNASIIITFYAFFYLHNEIFPNVVMEDFIYLILFGVFMTAFLLLFIHKIRKVKNSLKELAYKDPLTGAANRLLLKEKFDLLKSIKVHSIAIVFIDMNGFKRINDTYGHEVGDQLLERFVSRLNDFLRDTDLLCRLGGDEFIILSSNIDIENLESLLEKIQLVLDKPMNMNNLEIKVSASIGWSYSTEVSNADLEDMIKEADKAMYKAKGSELLSGDL